MNKSDKVSVEVTIDENSDLDGTVRIHLPAEAFPEHMYPSYDSYNPPPYVYYITLGKEDADVLESQLGRARAARA